MPANTMHRKHRPFVLTTCLFGALSWSTVFGATAGVDERSIRLGGVMDLQGLARGLGEGMRRGLEAAFEGRSVQGKALQLVVRNDNYSPERTAESTKKLLREGVFAMVGNVGTPTAKKSLPILAEQNVPAVGFFTGAGLLRTGKGPIVNYRASYSQEIAAVISSALESSEVTPQEVCAFVQDDAYGMAGIAGFQQAVSQLKDMDPVKETLDKIIELKDDSGTRNQIGPVGVYTRNTLLVRDGYLSLKDWEQKSGKRCKLVVSVGAYSAVARFIAYSRSRGENWIVSAVSFTGADKFRAELEDFGVRNRVVMTQVVPPLNSDLAIVGEARDALGSDFGYVTLEGYIVGRMVIDALSRIDGNITREAFLSNLKGQQFELGGMRLDFRDDNQGSDYVSVTRLDNAEYKPLTTADWRQLLAP